MKCIQGAQQGLSGMIVSVDGGQCTIFSDITREQVFVGWGRAVERGPIPGAWGRHTCCRGPGGGGGQGFASLFIPAAGGGPTRVGPTRFDLI